MASPLYAGYPQDSQLAATVECSGVFLTIPGNTVDNGARGAPHIAVHDCAFAAGLDEGHELT